MSFLLICLNLNQRSSALSHSGLPGPHVVNRATVGAVHLPVPLLTLAVAVVDHVTLATSIGRVFLVASFGVAHNVLLALFPSGGRRHGDEWTILTVAATSQ